MGPSAPFMAAMLLKRNSESESDPTSLSGDEADRF